MEEKKEELVEIHREDTFNRLLFFYNTIKDLYAGENLGGVRFVAVKPAK